MGKPGKAEEFEKSNLSTPCGRGVKNVGDADVSGASSVQMCCPELPDNNGDNQNVDQRAAEITGTPRTMHRYVRHRATTLHFVATFVDTLGGTA